MKVLFANPPAYLYDENKRYIQGGSRWSHSYKLNRLKTEEMIKKKIYPYTPYPFFLGYAASNSLDVGKVDFLDGVALNYNEQIFIDKIKKMSPDLVVLETPTVSFPLVMKLIREIKSETGTKIAIAGIHATAKAIQEMYSNKFIDFAFTNEFEESSKELIMRELNPKGVKGVIYREENNVQNNGPRPYKRDIDELNYPFRDPSVIDRYEDFTLIGHPNVQMMSSRGCPVGCNFCYTTVFYQNPIYRPRSAIKVVQEMDYIQERYHAKQIYFDDDTISINPNHISSISNTIIQERSSIPWTCMGDITVSEENVRLMAKANCIGMKFGVESSDPEVLLKMHKGIVSSNKVLKFRDILKKYNIWAHATFSIGHPGDTEDTIRANIEFVKMLKPDSIQISMATPVPGTKFFEEAEANDWLVSPNWIDFDGNSEASLSYPHLPKESIDRLFEEFWDYWNNRKLGFRGTLNLISKRKHRIVERILK